MMLTFTSFNVTLVYIYRRVRYIVWKFGIKCRLILILNLIFQYTNSTVGSRVDLAK